MVEVAGEDAGRILAEVRLVRERTKAAVHAGAWFPVLVIAVLMLASIALYVQPFAQVHSNGAPFGAGLPSEARSEMWSYIFWLVGTPASFALIAWWYQARARRIGMKVRWRWFAVTGLGALVAQAVLAAAPVSMPDPNLLVAGPASPITMSWLLSPLLPVAAALIALGMAERSTALAVTGTWIGFAMWWVDRFGMGRMPGWATWLIDGGQGSGPGSEVAVLGLSRPGPMLIVLALPLLVVAAVRAARDQSARRSVTR